MLDMRYDIAYVTSGDSLYIRSADMLQIKSDTLWCNLSVRYMEVTTGNLDSGICEEPDGRRLQMIKYYKYRDILPDEPFMDQRDIDNLLTV